MRIYDISQEVFGCAVFPGDPKPERIDRLKISEGAVCNLSAFSMCAHNGTHVDAPLHFLNEGKSIDQVEIDRFIGYAYVAAHEGRILAVPALEANNADAELVHEAAIGKIAGDQRVKLMTLGLTEQEAEEQIINGFLR